MVLKTVKGVVGNEFEGIKKKLYYAMYFLPIFGAFLASIGWGVFHGNSLSNRFSHMFYMAMCAWLMPVFCFIAVGVRKFNNIMAQ